MSDVVPDYMRGAKIVFGKPAWAALLDPKDTRMVSEIVGDEPLDQDVRFGLTYDGLAVVDKQNEVGNG